MNAQNKMTKNKQINTTDFQLLNIFAIAIAIHNVDIVWPLKTITDRTSRA